MTSGILQVPPPAKSPPQKRVLIVSPNFPPSNTPDMQRVRLSLPYLRQHGWEPTVLAVDPKYSGTGVLDPLLERTYPSDIRVLRVSGISPKFTRRFGLGSLWLRCGGALRRAAEALLASERFDLVFFSTTVFDAFALGPVWLRRFGVPCVLDYQDPWINFYYARTRTTPPGGWLKYKVVQWLARHREPDAVRHAAAILTVSEAYGQQLVERYADLEPSRIKLLPFGAAAADLAIAATHAPANRLIDFADGNFHHVYIGRCGADMKFALTAIFHALRRYHVSHPTEAERIRFHFIGTSYASAALARDSVLPLAAAAGVERFVHEHRLRVPYFDALHYIINAHALLMVGSDDRTYTASKLFPYVLARKPLLVVFHENSLVCRLAQSIDAGVLVPFASSLEDGPLAEEIYRRWFATGGYRISRPIDETAIRPFTAEFLTAQLAGIFDLAAAPTGRNPPTV